MEDGPPPGCAPQRAARACLRRRHRWVPGHAGRSGSERLGQGAAPRSAPRYHSPPWLPCSAALGALQYGRHLGDNAVVCIQPQVRAGGPWGASGTDARTHSRHAPTIGPVPGCMCSPAAEAHSLTVAVADMRQCVTPPPHTHTHTHPFPPPPPPGQRAHCAHRDDVWHISHPPRQGWGRCLAAAAKPRRGCPFGAAWRASWHFGAGLLDCTSVPMCTHPSRCQPLVSIPPNRRPRVSRRDVRDTGTGALQGRRARPGQDGAPDAAARRRLGGDCRRLLAHPGAWVTAAGGAGAGCLAGGSCHILPAVASHSAVPAAWAAPSCCSWCSMAPGCSKAQRNGRTSIWPGLCTITTHAAAPCCLPPRPCLRSLSTGRAPGALTGGRRLRRCRMRTPRAPPGSTRQGVAAPRMHLKRGHQAAPCSGVA